MVLMADSSGGSERERVLDKKTKHRVYEILKGDGHYTVAEVAAEAGIEKSEAERYLWKLASEGRARRTADGYAAIETVEVESSMRENGNSATHAA